MDIVSYSGKYDKSNKDLNKDNIKIRRLRCAHHIITTEDETIPKKVPNGKFHNTRPVGKPRTKWEFIVWRNISQILGIRGWKRQAEDRDDGRHLLRDARAQKGL